ncbi:DUF5947 family protein [Streptomyces rubiginosohelvolus]|uniref:DUF5947 family protein n=1 Tax=Streptomyces rubiginosohelvolus TaxID=67362 RepID=UPI0037A3D109
MAADHLPEPRRPRRLPRRDRSRARGGLRRRPRRKAQARPPPGLRLSPQDDVEALLLHAERGRPATCTLVPIDVCYELVGRMRLHCKGFDGGAEARVALAEFFDRVGSRARPLPTEDGGAP